jgi:predicted lactoylglutathione lyase
MKLKYVCRLGSLPGGKFSKVEHSLNDQVTSRAALNRRFVATLGFTVNQTFGYPRHEAVALWRQFCFFLLTNGPFQTFDSERLSLSGTIVAEIECTNIEDSI